MPFVGTGHIWLIGILLVIVLIVWGPGKLPEVGSGMGRAIREFRKATSDVKEEFGKATRPAEPVVPVVPVAPVATEPAPVAPISVVPSPAVGAVATGRQDDHVGLDSGGTTTR